MASKALWGALMGAGQGISQYGSWLGTNALAEDADRRISRRQQSLEEIRERYQNQRTADTRAYQDSVRADNRAYELEKLDPDSEYYRRSEALRTKQADEALGRSKELRETPYGGTSSRVPTAIQNTEYYQSLSPEERAIYDRVNKISDEDVLDQKDKDKFVLSLYEKFMGKTPFEQEDTMKGLGIDPDLPPDQAQAALISAFRGMIDTVAGPQSDAPPGLMNYAPGSSRENPLDATLFDSKPPPGTWVRLPNGEIKQVQ